MQADVFPRTSGARYPIVIVKIFIFLLLKVVLQNKPCKGEHCNLEGWARHLHVPQTQRITYICLQGALEPRPRSLLPRKFFLLNRNNWKTYFFELLLGILSDLCETWYVHSPVDLWGLI